MPETTPSKPLELFFSYSHKDQTLRDALESHLASLKKQRLIADWHDRKITAGTDWAGQIDENLERASIILLLISSDFLNSDYCTDIELKRAIERNAAREARVIPVILRPSDWEYPPLKGLQALPRDAKPVTTWANLDEAFLDVVKGISKVVQELNEVSIEHYANMVKRAGCFEGVGKQLSDGDVARRQYSVRFHRKAGRIEKVQIVNGQGQLTGAYDMAQTTDLAGQPGTGAVARECQWDYVRGLDGAIWEERARDEANRFVYTLRYVTGPDPHNITAHYVNTDGFIAARASSGAASLKIVRSDSGFDKEVRYFDKDGTPQPDDNGSYGERRGLNDAGQATFVTNLGYDGKPAWRRDGYAQFSFEYDSQGNATLSRCLDVDGKAAVQVEGWSSLKSKYDDWGNRIEATSLDESGNPVRGRSGQAITKSAFDGQGRQTWAAYFDEQENPTKIVDGYQRWTATYDARGRVLDVELWDEHGNRTRGRDGIAFWKNGYDTLGNQAKVEYFDEQEQRTRNRDGFSRAEWDFDDLARLVAGRYFDESGKLTRRNDGYAQEAFEYNEHGFVKRTVYRDVDGQLARHVKGYSTSRAVYDERGKTLEWVACFGENDAPVRTIDGYSTIVSSYDKQGNKISEEYYDDSSEPDVRKTPDQQTGMEHRAYVKSSVVPAGRRRALASGGYAGWEATYDERGFQTSATYIGLDGKFTVLRDGSSAWVAANDDRGNITKKRFLKVHVTPETYQTELRPTKLADGYAGWTAEYDKKGNRTSRTYIDEEEKPCVSVEDYVTAVYAFDWRGNETEVSYLDADGKPTRHRDGFLKCVRTYDDWGSIVERCFSGFDKNLGFTQVRTKYDALGRETEQYFFDDAGQPARHDGYLGWTKTYDEQGRLKQQDYLGYAGLGNLASLLISYDPDQNLRTDEYFDSQGKPISFQNRAKRVVKADEHGNRVEAFLDERGRTLQMFCFDNEEHPAPHQDGWFRFTADYDESGRRTAERYFGPNGEPLVLADGYASWALLEFPEKRQLEWRFFGADGHPVKCKDGYASSRLTYNAAGHCQEAAFFDEADQLINIKAGYAREVASYDGTGTLTNTTRYDANAVEVKVAHA